MTQEQYDKILWQKIRRHTSLYDRTTPMLYYASGGGLNNEEKKLMRLLNMAHENIELFTARHPEFTPSWLKKAFAK